MFSAIPAKGWVLTALMGFLILITSFFLPDYMKTGWLVGYSVGFLAMLFHIINFHFSAGKPGIKFISYYYAGLFIRFMVVCGIFIFLLVMTKIDEFSFTVSFIISYLLHSIIEVIFLNQKLSE